MHCDFKIILEGIDSFYVGHKADELIEYILLMMTRIGEDNEISGYIERIYCPDCDKLIMPIVKKLSTTFLSLQIIILFSSYN